MSSATPTSDLSTGGILRPPACRGDLPMHGRSNGSLHFVQGRLCPTRRPQSKRACPLPPGALSGREQARQEPRSRSPAECVLFFSRSARGNIGCPGRPVKSTGRVRGKRAHAPNPRQSRGQGPGPKGTATVRPYELHACRVRARSSDWSLPGATESHRAPRPLDVGPLSTVARSPARPHRRMQKHPTDLSHAW